SALATRYANFLRSLARRTGEEGVTARLTELFRAPLIGGPLHVVRTSSGKTYYLTAPVDFTGEPTAAFTYVVGTDPSRDKKSMLLKKSEVSFLKSSPAPQVALADDVLKNLPQAGVGDWDVYLLRLSKDVLATRDLDPFLGHLLLTELLAAAADGNAFLVEPLAELRGRLADEEIDPAARWMNPDDVSAGLSRQRAAAALRRVTAADLDAAWRAAAEAERALTEELGRPYRRLGWLRREGARWECCGGEPPGGSVPASVAVPGAGGASWQPVGRIAAADASLFGSELKQGRLLFAPDGPATKISASKLGTSR
ncbi:MAG TPA: hypothetical protein VF170_19350, partial [Planctomycetaceae bacterium]